MTAKEVFGRKVPPGRKISFFFFGVGGCADIEAVSPSGGWP